MIKEMIHSYGMPAILAVLIALSSDNYREKLQSLPTERVQINHSKTAKVVLTSADLIKVDDDRFGK